MTYSGWKLTEESRELLLYEIPPEFPDVICHHVTKEFGSNVLPENALTATVIGYDRDPQGLECLVARINGFICRPDGGIYHITHSLDRSKGFKPVMSNDLLKEDNWIDLEPIPIKLEPFVGS